jgi:hypothetical protein
MRSWSASRTSRRRCTASTRASTRGRSRSWRADRRRGARGRSPDGERRLALFRRQRATLDELAERRAALLHQLESAGLALGNLRLDLVKFRSAGGQAALTDVSTATQEARVLSREIADMLAAAAEVRSL